MINFSSILNSCLICSLLFAWIVLFIFIISLSLIGSWLFVIVTKYIFIWILFMGRYLVVYLVIGVVVEIFTQISSLQVCNNLDSSRLQSLLLTLRSRLRLLSWNQCFERFCQILIVVWLTRMVILDIIIIFTNEMLCCCCALLMFCSQWLLALNLSFWNRLAFKWGSNY